MAFDAESVALRWTTISVSERGQGRALPAAEAATNVLRSAGHRILEEIVLAPDQDEIHGTLDMVARDPEIDAALTVGATGLAASDVALEGANRRIGTTIPGFAEAFRALAGDMGDPLWWARRARAATLPAPDAVKLVFQLPDLADVVEVAMTDLVLPSVGAVWMEANPGVDGAARWPAASDGARSRDAT